jgi:hypothetical protein
MQGIADAAYLAFGFQQQAERSSTGVRASN